jgi:hypothetical protein
MNTTEEDLRVAKLRTCIFRAMAALALIDLSAHSREAALKVIQQETEAAWDRPGDRDVVMEASIRIAVCLKHLSADAARQIGYDLV